MLFKSHIIIREVTWSFKYDVFDSMNISTKVNLVFPEIAKIFHVFNVNSSVSWYNSYFISLLSYSISCFFEQDFERKGWHVGGYPYIPMIQYKRHKNRFFFKTRSILFGCGPSLSVCQSRISLYIFFLARGDLEINLYFSLFTGSWLDLGYICMFV